ncbi:myelin protein zero-like protein 3 [Cyprinodon tularosa]|uniref:myelin protein zero-like protein 3 n=1 Tax=Cyprinodon tularosa TaxID=77115 RepID=UPI0018E1EED0|nr:myelin protein zero-like protein 3 [Cyprinodon tularosa]
MTFKEMRTYRLYLLIVNIIFITSFPDLQAQKLEVLPEVPGYLGHEVVLRCRFITSSKDSIVSQVQWDIKSESENSTILVFNSDHGMTIRESSLKDRVNLTEHSLKITDLKLTDTGSYTCSISVYPSGSFKKSTTLIVYDEPVPEQKQVQTSPGILSAIIISVLLLLVILTAAAYLTYIKRQNAARRLQVHIDTSRRLASVTRPSYIFKEQDEVVYADVTPKRMRESESSLNKKSHTAAQAEEVTYSEVKVYHQRPNLETMFSL